MMSWIHELRQNFQHLSTAHQKAQRSFFPPKNSFRIFQRFLFSLRFLILFLFSALKKDFHRRLFARLEEGRKIIFYLNTIVWGCVRLNRKTSGN